MSLLTRIGFRRIRIQKRIKTTPRIKRTGMGINPSDTSITISSSSRDDRWLISRLDHLWGNYFKDVTQDNPVFIRFGRYSKLRLGSIRLERHTRHTYITITGMFKDPNIPMEVVDHTIAHEMCHYLHGFSSLKPRLHKYPHHGGVVNRELKLRDMDFLIKAYSKWLKDYRKILS